MARVRVRVSHLAMKMETGGFKVFKTDEEFDCPAEKVAELGNRVQVIPDPEPLNRPEQPPGKKRG